MTLGGRQDAWAVCPSVPSRPALTMRSHGNASHSDRAYKKDLGPSPQTDFSKSCVRVEAPKKNMSLPMPYAVLGCQPSAAAARTSKLAGAPNHLKKPLVVPCLLLLLHL